jgi:ABC-type nickel/cobalt efflux system permease component RcnA
VLLVATLAIVGALLPGVASAHPLGNFTVNHYARIEPRLDGLRIAYVLDEAEIPTFQDRPQISADPDAFADQRAAAIGANLHVSVDGRPVALHLDSRSLTLPDGAGGLPTLRLEATYSASYAAASKLEVRDDNDPTRIGWREIVATPGDAATDLQHASVPSTDVTNALHQYPEDLLNSPLDVRQATLTLTPASASQPGATTRVPADASQPDPATLTAAIAPSGNAVLDRARATFADLANTDELTPAFLIFAVGVALVLGAAHALQPGHGKTVVAAYLVGSRGTARHAAFLGLTVTATHTAGVYALGLVTLALSQYILPERLYPILEVGSGALVLGIGLWLLGQRLLTAVGLRRAHEHSHPHGHDHHHHHSTADHSLADHSSSERSLADHSLADHSLDGHSLRGRQSAEGHSDDGHHHHHPQGGARVGWRSLLALGISGGLLPCPEALMVLLITIAAHRVLFGLLLIVSFSTGLAAVLVGFGLLLVYARGLFTRLNLNSGLVPRLLPVASAFVIVITGSLITAQALPQVL